MSKLQYCKSLNGTYDFKLDDGWCVANCKIDNQKCIIYLIVTEPAHQGRGEAQRLLKYLRARCVHTNRELIVWGPNDRMKHICEKMGIKMSECMEDSPYGSVGGFANKIHEVLEKTKRERGAMASN